MGEIKYTVGENVIINTFCGEQIFGKITPINKIPKSYIYVKGYYDKNINLCTLYKKESKKGIFYLITIQY